MKMGSKVLNLSPKKNEKILLIFIIIKESPLESSL